MHYSTGLRALALGLIVGAIAAHPGRAQVSPGITADDGGQKYALLDRYAAGDVCTVDFNIDSRVTVTAETGCATGSFDASGSMRERFREEILAVDAKGPTAGKITYSFVRASVQSPVRGAKIRNSQMKGRTISYRRQGDKQSVTTSKGKLTPAERAAYIRMFRNRRDYTLPNRPVAVGESWSIPSKIAAARFLPGTRRAATEVTFEEVTEWAGHPCARLHLTMNFQGTFGKTPLEGNLEGDVYYALDLQRIVAEEVSGPTSTHVTQTVKGRQVEVSGDGTLTIKNTIKWHKVASRPVTSSAMSAAL
jgi:hypothetical protein